MIEATIHAVDRYIERVAPVSREEAARVLTSRRMEAAALFGAQYVRLGGGQRAVLKDGYVVTVLPAHAKRGYLAKKIRGEA